MVVITSCGNLYGNDCTVYRYVCIRVHKYVMCQGFDTHIVVTRMLKVIILNLSNGLHNIRVYVCKYVAFRVKLIYVYIRKSILFIRCSGCENKIFFLKSVISVYNL